MRWLEGALKWLKDFNNISKRREHPPCVSCPVISMTSTDFSSMSRRQLAQRLGVLADNLERDQPASSAPSLLRTTATRLCDADTLEESAKILDPYGFRQATETCRSMAKDLRLCCEGAGDCWKKWWERA
jgi:hypothetical protein